jgi:hypothetical protein
MEVWCTGTPLGTHLHGEVEDRRLGRECAGQGERLGMQAAAHKLVAVQLAADNKPRHDLEEHRRNLFGHHPKSGAEAVHFHAALALALQKDGRERVDHVVQHVADPHLAVHARECRVGAEQPQQEVQCLVARCLARRPAKHPPHGGQLLVGPRVQRARNVLDRVQHGPVRPRRHSPGVADHPRDHVVPLDDEVVVRSRRDEPRKRLRQTRPAPRGAHIHV